MMDVSARAKASEMLNKVPEVTVFFWVIKIMATTVGETAADFINVNLGLGLSKTSIIMGVLLVVAPQHFHPQAPVVVMDHDPVHLCVGHRAYILTRPFGASCGDLLSLPVANGGLGLGTLGTSGLFLTIILALVSYLTLSRKDVISGTGSA